jgi:hypothetical protein
VSQVHNAASDLAVVQYITLPPLAQHETLSMSQVANTRFSYLKERTPVLLRAVRDTRHLGLYMAFEYEGWQGQRFCAASEAVKEMEGCT